MDKTRSAMTACALALLCGSPAWAQWQVADSGADLPVSQLQSDAQRQDSRDDMIAASARPGGGQGAFAMPPAAPWGVDTEAGMSTDVPLQTDRQRQAAKATRAARQQPPPPSPYGDVGMGNTMGTTLGTAVAVDLINAAAGTATNAVVRSNLRRDPEPDLESGDGQRDPVPPGANPYDPPRP